MKHLAWKARIVIDMTVKATQEDYQAALDDARLAIETAKEYPTWRDVPENSRVSRAGYNVGRNLLGTYKGDVEKATQAMFYAILRKSLRDSAIKDYIRAEEFSGVSATCEVTPKSNKLTTKKETQ